MCNLGCLPPDFYKTQCNLKLEPNANAVQSTKMDAQILSSLKSAVNMKSRPTVFAKQWVLEQNCPVWMLSGYYTDL